MPTKFLFPCTCGEKLPIETSQAGQSVTCACGAVLTIPTMREIARLERLEQAGPARAPVSWSPLQGLMFAGGLLMIVAGLLAAAYFAVSRAQFAGAALPDVAADDTKFEREIEAATADVVHDQWQQITAEGLGHWHPPAHVVKREVLSALTARIAYSLLAFGIGVGLAGGSFFVGPRRPRLKTAG